MRKILIFIFVLITTAVSLGDVFGQTVTIENNRKWVVVNFIGKPIPASEQDKFKVAANYKFYELLDPKGVNIRANAVHEITVDDAEFRLAGEHLILKLNQALEYEKIYMLKISNAEWDKKEVPVIRFELGKEPVVKAFNDPRNKMRLESNVEMSQTGVEVNETILKISPDKKSLLVEPTTVDVTPEKITPTKMNLTFKRKLSEARNHYFVIGLRADDGTPLTAKGKVTVPGLPPPNPNYNIDFTLSSEFGDHLKPQFNLSGVFKKELWRSADRVFYLEPTVSFDLGLGATKSKNAIILDLPTVKHTFYIEVPAAGCRIEKEPEFRQPFAEIVENSELFDNQKHEIPLPCYYEWENRHPLSLYSIDFKTGPKFEMDRRFARVNLLGSARLDFNFDRWQHSIAKRRSYLERDLSKTKDYKENYKDVYIKTGYEITPRIGFEFGRKMTTEVIENKSKTIRHLIPQYPILRGYVGISNVFEWNYGFLPMKLTISEDLFYLGYSETIGEIKDNALNLRKIRGFHPYGKVSLDIAFDPAKRYNFSITYENGRAAPNFEYLNTFKTGFRVIY